MAPPGAKEIEGSSYGPNERPSFSIANLGREIVRDLRDNCRTLEDRDGFEGVLMSLGTGSIGPLLRSLDNSIDRQAGLVHPDQWDIYPQKYQINWGEMVGFLSSIGLPASLIYSLIGMTKQDNSQVKSELPQEEGGDTKDRRITRRDFIKISLFTGGLTTAGTMLVSCKPQPAQGSEATPVPATAVPTGELPPPTAETAKNPEQPNFNRLDIKNLKPWADTLALKVGETNNQSIKTPGFNIPIVATRTADNAIKLNDLGLEFRETHVRVNLPFDGDPTNTGVYANGMRYISYPYDKVRTPGGKDVENKSLTQIAQAFNLKPENLRFVGATSTGALTGHSEVWSILKEGKVAGYLAAPWLTGENVFAEYTTATETGKPEIVFRDKDKKELASIPFERLIVKLDRNEDAKEEEVISVSRDGRYMISKRKFDDAGNTVSIVPVSTLSKRLEFQNKLLPEVTKIYDNLFDPHITAGDWASFKEGDAGYSEKVKGKVNPTKMYRFVGSQNNAHQSSLDLEFGTMRLVVNTGKVITAENHLLERVKVAKALETQEGLKTQLKAIRNEMAKIYFDEVDFRNFTIVVEKGKATQAVYRTPYQEVKYKIGDDFSLKVILSREAGRAAEVRELEANLMPRLAFNINGEMIRTDLPDSVERRVKLGGVATISPIDATDRWPMQKTFDGINTTKAIRANAIRLQIVPSLALKDLETTKYIVEEAERNGLYIMLSPAAKSTAQGVYNDIKAPDEDTIRDVAQLAKELEKYNNVILDVWNEINYYGAEVNNEQIYNLLDHAVREIRKNNSHVITALPGPEDSQNFAYFAARPIQDPLVWYGVMDNVRERGPRGDGLGVRKSNLWRGLVEKKLPVFYRESNYPERPTEAQLAAEPAWMQESFNYAKQYPFQVHVFGWLLAGSGWPMDLVAKPGQPGAKQISGVPGLENIWFTRRGFELANYFLNNSITQFDK